MELTHLVHPQPVTDNETSTTPSRPQHSRGIGRLLRTPLLHFLAIGGLLYVATSEGREAPPPLVVVTSEDVANLADQWKRNTGRAPNEEERGRLIGQFVDDALLIQVARSLGWDRDDTVVQRRLIQNLRFLDAAPDKTDDQVLMEAYALNMHQNDIVVRRRLLERVRLVIADRARSRAPTDEELQTYLDANRKDFLRPSRARMTQVYLSRDRRGAALHNDALKLVEKLVTSRLYPSRDLEEIIQLGDPFLLQPQLPLWSKRRLSERLGPSFAEGVARLPIGQWSGPVASSYGEHAVWVHERLADVYPQLAEIRDKVTAEVHRKWEKEALQRTLDELRSKATIEIASAADESTSAQ